MDDADAAEIVALVAAYDPYQRLKVSNIVVDAWTLALSDVDAVLAQRAVVRFFQTVADRPMGVADVRRLAAEIDAEDRAWRKHQELTARRAEDRRALPPASPARDRRADIAALIAAHRNWSPVGDLQTRRTQARFHPALKEKYREALIETARAEQHDTPENGENDS